MNLTAIALAQEAGLVAPKWLVSREFGLKFLPTLQEKLGNLALDQILILDMKDISLLEWSFADEVFGTLAVQLAAGDFPRRYLILENLSDTSIENLQIALTTRPEREKKAIRNLVLPIRKAGSINAIGKMESHLRPVWDLVRKQNEITARDISSTLNLEINTASTKLKTLFDLRLLKRKELKTDTGKQYIYSTI